MSESKRKYSKRKMKMSRASGEWFGLALKELGLENGSDAGEALGVMATTISGWRNADFVPQRVYLQISSMLKNARLDNKLNGSGPNRVEVDTTVGFDDASDGVRAEIQDEILNNLTRIESSDDLLVLNRISGLMANSARYDGILKYVTKNL